jgi:hypothetical protein
VGCRLACGLLRCVRWCAHRQQTTAVGRGGGLHTYQCAAANPARAFRLQSGFLAGRVAELGSLI